MTRPPTGSRSARRAGSPSPRPGSRAALVRRRRPGRRRVPGVARHRGRHPPGAGRPHPRRGRPRRRVRRAVRRSRPGGRRLDAVVFEQYKSQGRHGRTYLPMPFAHVVGGRRLVVGLPRPHDPPHLVRRRRLRPRPARRRGRRWAAPPTRVSTSPCTTAARRRCCPPSSTRSAAPRSCRTGCSGSGRPATSGTPRSSSWQRMDTHRELDIPVGVVVIEAWSDEEGIIALPRRPVPGPDRRLSHRGRRLRVPRRRGLAGPAGDGRRAARPRHQGGAVADPAAQDGRTPRTGCTPRCWPRRPRWSRVTTPSARPTARRTATAAGGSRSRSCPTCPVQRTRDWWTAKRRLPRR